MDILKEIMECNQQFVEKKEYLNFTTTKYPDKKIVIVTCMDTRLLELLPKAIGVKNGDIKTIKNAGGVVVHPFGSAMRSILITIYEFDVEYVLVIGHDGCGMASVDKSHVIDKMISLGINENTLNVLSNSGIEVKDWLAGFENVDESVKESVSIIENHPLIHEEVKVVGLIINSETGELRYPQ